MAARLLNVWVRTGSASAPALLSPLHVVRQCLVRGWESVCCSLPLASPVALSACVYVHLSFLPFPHHNHNIRHFCYGLNASSHRLCVRLRSGCRSTGTLSIAGLNETMCVGLLCVYEHSLWCATFHGPNAADRRQSALLWQVRGVRRSDSGVVALHGREVVTDGERQHYAPHGRLRSRRLQ